MTQCTGCFRNYHSPFCFLRIDVGRNRIIKWQGLLYFRVKKLLFPKRVGLSQLEKFKWKDVKRMIEIGLLGRLFQIFYLIFDPVPIWTSNSIQFQFGPQIRFFPFKGAKLTTWLKNQVKYRNRVLFRSLMFREFC